MKNLHTYLICLLLLSSCNNEAPVKSENSTITTRFYYRVPGCNDGYCTYDDYLVLENYTNNKHTISELAKLAYDYIDTAKADMPISGITFVGEKPGSRLPTGMYHRYYEHADNQVVDFSFNNSLRQDSTMKKPAIREATLWKKGKSLDAKSPIDSLLNSTELLDNEN